MPKLSEDTLKKRFTCPHCGESLRTRQGLSGHIQWKHAAGKAPLSLEFDSLNEMAKGFEKYGKFMLLSATQIKSQQDILKQWLEVSIFCKYLGIKPNNTDFKSYIITSLAQMYRNEELRKEIIANFRDILEEYKQHE